MRLALPLAALTPYSPPSPASAAPKPSRTCDFLDRAVCLQPWPNDYFRKDGRIALSRRRCPADKDGKRIDPAGWNRNDGFSPGQTILTHVRGLDNARAFRRTNPVQLSRPQPLHGPEGADRRDQRADRRASSDLGRARPAPEAPARREPPDPARASTGTRARATSSPCASSATRRGRRHSARAPPSGSTATARRRDNRLIERRRAHMNSIFRKLRKAGDQAQEPLPRLGLHGRQRAQPHRARAPHARRRIRAARRHQPRGRRRCRGTPRRSR